MTRSLSHHYSLVMISSRCLALEEVSRHAMETLKLTLWIDLRDMEPTPLVSSWQGPETSRQRPHGSS